jgi:hypothetical protein
MGKCYLLKKNFEKKKKEGHQGKEKGFLTQGEKNDFGPREKKGGRE